jgi:non-ribosomal peptide synthetase component F
MDAHSVNTSIKPDELGSVCVPELVQRRAALTPDALAVCGGSDRITYRELKSVPTSWRIICAVVG